MINGKMYYNIGYRSVGQDEAQLQKGFDEGYTQGVGLGLILGQFIAQSNLNQSILDPTNDEMKVLKGMLEKDPRMNINQITLAINQLSQ